MTTPSAPLGNTTFVCRIWIINSAKRTIISGKLTVFDERGAHDHPGIAKQLIFFSRDQDALTNTGDTHLRKLRSTYSNSTHLLPMPKTVQNDVLTPFPGKKNAACITIKKRRYDSTAPSPPCLVNYLNEMDLYIFEMEMLLMQVFCKCRLSFLFPAAMLLDLYFNIQVAHHKTRFNGHLVSCGLSFQMSFCNATSPTLLSN